MKKTILLKTPWHLTNLCNQAPFIDFGFETDEFKNIKSVIVNDTIISFTDNCSPHLIRNIYKCFTQSTSFTESENKVLTDIYQTVTVPSDIAIYSNKSNPYCGSRPDEGWNKRIYPENLMDLCESFMEIKDTEDRFGAYWNKNNALVFYYAWKE